MVDGQRRLATVGTCPAPAIHAGLDQHAGGGGRFDPFEADVASRVRHKEERPGRGLERAARHREGALPPFGVAGKTLVDHDSAAGPSGNHADALQNCLPGRV
jgi:hypothetical protein